MGKTPGKWIKSLLLGKKSSKSNPSKKKDIFKPSSNKDVLVPTVLSVSDPTLASSPTSGSIATIAVLSEKEVVSVSSTNNVILSYGDEEANAKSVVNLGSQDDCENEKIKLREATIKAQAAFRGYLARRSLRKLNGVIQLQALIRGHLVRRQAVSTLCCVKGIVKFQALARGYMVRSSGIGLAVHKICKVTKSSSSIGANKSAQEKHLESVFVHKLLASSSSVVPLYINYDPGEPNLTWNWLDRWTTSHFWAHLPESKKKLESVSGENNSNCETIENNESHLKRNAQKVSGVKIENGFMPASSKDKTHSKRVSSRPLHSGQEHSQKEVEKNIKTPVHSVSDRSQVSNEKRKHVVQKTSSLTVTDVAEQGQNASTEKMKDLTASKLKQSDQEKDLGPQAEDEHDNQEEGIQGFSEDLNSSDNCTSNMNPENSQIRASLPANFDGPENEVHNTPRLPSYMAPTQSAKARLKGQCSPGLASDLVEKNGVTRRHSLSSSFNGKLGSYSPRAERPVAVSSRGMIQTNRSLSSSRDGTDKLIQPRWRR